MKPVKFVYRGSRRASAECARIGRISPQLFRYRLRANLDSGMSKDEAVRQAVEVSKNDRVKRCTYCRQTGHYRTTCEERLAKEAE